jgi:hypothetical protein
MLDELRNWSVRCTRRRLLLGAVSAAGAVTAGRLPPGETAAAMKISQKAVAYQDHPDGDRECSKCAQFQAPNSCKMVEGPINPRGFCRIFIPLRQASAGLPRRDAASSEPGLAADAAVPS